MKKVARRTNEKPFGDIFIPPFDISESLSENILRTREKE